MPFRLCVVPVNIGRDISHPGGRLLRPRPLWAPCRRTTALQTESLCCGRMPCSRCLWSGCWKRKAIREMMCCYLVNLYWKLTWQLELPGSFAPNKIHVQLGGGLDYVLHIWAVLIFRQTWARHNINKTSNAAAICFPINQLVCGIVKRHKLNTFTNMWNLQNLQQANTRSLYLHDESIIKIVD